MPKDGATFDFAALRADVNSDAACFKSPAAGGVYKVDATHADSATAIDRAYTGGSFSATDTQFTFAADATATSGTTNVKICYEKAVAYDSTVTGMSVYVDGSDNAELACTATVSIINCVFAEAAALSAITHNTAFETEVDLGGLRDSILDTDACWATAVGVDGNNKPRILELDGSSDPVDHTVDTASGGDSKVTLAHYNRDSDPVPTNAELPGYAVKACFDNYAGDAICSAAAALTETFDECPTPFATPSVSGTYKWDVSQAVTLNFGAIRDSVHDETDSSYSPSGADNLRCWAAGANAVLFKSDGTAVPGQTVVSQTASSTVVTLAADSTLTTGGLEVKICFEKKADGTQACTATFNILACKFDTAVTVSDIAHNTPFQLTVDYGDVRDQINDENACFQSNSDFYPGLHGSADNGDCIDDPNYYDDYGDGCEFYNEDPDECGGYYDDYTYWQGANDACCVCGGGSTNSLSFG